CPFYEQRATRAHHNGCDGCFCRIGRAAPHAAGFILRLLIPSPLKRAWCCQPRASARRRAGPPQDFPSHPARWLLTMDDRRSTIDDVTSSIVDRRSSIVQRTQIEYAIG